MSDTHYYQTRSSLRERVRKVLLLPYKAFLYLKRFGIKAFLVNVDNRTFRIGLYMRTHNIRFVSAKRALQPYKRVYSALLEAAGSKKGSDYVALSDTDLSGMHLPVKLIAFYLPQFHPIPENDEWWGRGFTEWTNVSKAVPQFEGHYQPHYPDELGFYDLRLPEVQRRQVELARRYGIQGFCFYYYWFGGKRLLERPLDQYMADPSLDLPFCLCWANENWTRRWDGAENNVLIAQVHNEQEYAHFIRDIADILKDPRYIQVDGKPMVLVYRINLMPNPGQLAKVWREEARRLGLGELYLVAAQSFMITDPRPYGFDAAVEFPPHELGETQISTAGINITNPRFTGRVMDYSAGARMMIEKRVPDYTLFKTVMPSWDNTARRQDDASIFINSSPAAYRHWLERVIAQSRVTLPEEKRFVFINAWNEWAEGTHLEPDRRYGYAYLQATAEALIKKADTPDWTILFVSHDAVKGGAQTVIFNIINWFREHTNIRVKVLCLQGGNWLDRFREAADTALLSELGTPDNEEELLDRIREFCQATPDLIYANTVASGSAFSFLKKLGAPILTHFHELESSIQKYGAPWIHEVIDTSAHFIACSNAVEKNLKNTYGVPGEKISLVYEPVASLQVEVLSKEKKAAAKKKLGLDRDHSILLGCGFGMPFRKGADLFIRLGEQLLKDGFENFHLYWIGEFDPDYEDPGFGTWRDHLKKLEKPGLREHVTFLGMRSNVHEYLACGDMFILPSREDPFPLVALEAADCGLPILCFEGSGGMPDFVGTDAGRVVPFEDVEAMARQVVQWIKDKPAAEALGARARQKHITEFSLEQVIPHALSAARNTAGRLPAVSVIVPNYNHASYLAKRLDSIFNQTFQDMEVILLDDASSDNSLEILERYSSRADVQLIRNKRNSGSAFKQWLSGIDRARAEILWIAESDDLCEPDFLECLLPAFREPGVKLAYANSHIINEKDEVQGDYPSTEYLSSLSTEKWNRDYRVAAEQEINDGLGVKNTILNISSALVRRFEIDDGFREVLQGMTIAGDWYFIARAIRNGTVVYDSRKLNSHRRHSSSVIAQTISDRKLVKFFQEFHIVQDFIVNRYPLAETFPQKWENYLRKQWADFCPNVPFEELETYYPFSAMKEYIGRRVADTSGDL